MYPLRVRRETEFSPQTGKPNMKVSKTAPDNRQSFINKDVLPMKIITAAKQNMTRGPELLSEFCQQTFSKETVQYSGRVMTPFPLQSPRRSTFQEYHLLICVPPRENLGGPRMAQLGSHMASVCDS